MVKPCRKYSPSGTIFQGGSIQLSPARLPPTRYFDDHGDRWFLGKCSPLNSADIDRIRLCIPLPVGRIDQAAFCHTRPVQSAPIGTFLVEYQDDRCKLEKEERHTPSVDVAGEWRPLLSCRARGHPIPRPRHHRGGRDDRIHDEGGASTIPWSVPESLSSCS